MQFIILRALSLFSPPNNSFIICVEICASAMRKDTHESPQVTERHGYYYGKNKLTGNY